MSNYIKKHLGSQAKSMNKSQESTSTSTSGKSTQIEQSNSRKSFNSLAAEVHRRQLKSYNVLLYNVPVEDGVDDITQVKKALVNITDINLDSAHLKRFAKPSLRSAYPPIVVTFESKHDAAKVLAKWKLVEGDVQVAADSTKSQSEQFKKLKKLAKDHNLTNPRILKIVKVLDGEPTLVDFKPSEVHSSSDSDNDSIHSASSSPKAPKNCTHP